MEFCVTTDRPDFESVPVLGVGASFGMPFLGERRGSAFASASDTVAPHGTRGVGAHVEYIFVIGRRYLRGHLACGNNIRNKNKL